MPWTKLAVILSSLTALGCSVGVARPPLTLVGPRPPIIDRDDKITSEGVVWIHDLANAYLQNCVALSTLRHEDVKQCRQSLQ